MARRSARDERIEPVFDAPQARRADGELRLTPEDRVVGQPRGRKDSRSRKPPGRGGDGGSGSGGGKTRSPRRRRGGLTGFIGRLFYWSLVLSIWGGIAVACVVGYYAVRLPSMATWAVPERPPNARIVAADGQLLANRGKTGGEAMRLDEMSHWIPMAVVAIEDRRFRHHFGVDPVGLARAMATNVASGRMVQGGSTLTQQLAKNLFLEPDRTLERKIQEALIAIWLETKFSKDEILELYLNRVYFGSGAYGVDAAARRYFAKSARDVTLAEAALLAGLLKAPSALSPARNPKAAEARAQVVLGAMQREEMIGEGEAEKALAMTSKGARRYWSGSQHYVADIVMDQLPALIGEMRSDVIVQTTIDLGLQTEARKAVAETIAGKGGKARVSQGALVAMDPNGAIRALVGGRDYAESQFNRAWEAKRQPGSAFKPIVYLAAVEAGRTPATVREDAPVKIGNWTPENYDRKYRGPVTLDSALARSLNTIAAQLVLEVGPKTVVETAHRLGIKSELQSNASIALGTSEVTLTELAAAYAPFANGGYRVEPWLVRRVTTADGTILYERAAEERPQVVDGRALGMMNHMLRHVVEDGTGKAARIDGLDAAGKTGTTQNSRDALFVGYTANMVAAVWFGNDDGKPMNKVTGGGLPAEAWARFMRAAHQGVPPASLPGAWTPEPPAGVPPAAPGGLVTYDEGGGYRVEDPVSRPRPGETLTGEDRPRPRNILELLFGRKPG